jgi:hypothetical protein
MRFQEYYESPIFGGKFFSVDEFKNWYKSKYGSFDYESDCVGFNIPSYIIEPFKNGHFDPLTDKEKKLLNYFKNTSGDFYIIGANQNDPEYIKIIKHEFAHGIFFTNNDYRNSLINCLSSKKWKNLSRALKELDYANNVLEDEFNAYILTEPEIFEDYIPLREVYKLREVLDKIFTKFLGFSLLKSNINSIINRVKKILI